MNLTDYAENKLADMWRGQAWALPGTLYVGLASAASDTGATELSGTGYSRKAAARTLATWAGTQGSGTTSASSGTSKATSNNIAFDFGTAGTAWGTANHVVIYDAATGGNALVYLPITSTVIGAGSTFALSEGTVVGGFDATGAVTNHTANRLIDLIFRGQAFSFPATGYVALLTSGGAEISGAGYARVGVAGNLTEWSGTQGPGTGTASSGTGGSISNNGSITFPVPTGAWTAAARVGIYDAATGGSLLLNAALAAPYVADAGGPRPAFDPGQFVIQWA